MVSVSGRLATRRCQAGPHEEQEQARFEETAMDLSRSPTGLGATVSHSKERIHFLPLNFPLGNPRRQFHFNHERVCFTNECRAPMRVS